MNAPAGTIAVYKQGANPRFCMPDQLQKWLDLGYETEESLPQPVVLTKLPAVEAQAEGAQDDAIAGVVARAEADLLRVRTEELIWCCQELGIDPPNRAKKAELLKLLRDTIGA